MPKSLILAEKPSVAKDIARALGSFEDHKEYMESDEYVVSWAVGHLVEFVYPEDIDPKYKQWKLEDLPILPNPFLFKAKSGQTARLNQLKKLFKRKDVARVVNACDAGREGELIFRELVEHFKSDKPTVRLWLQSMTPEAIREGFRTLRPGAEYDRLGDAAKCRSEADWLIGINATRALTRRMKTRADRASWSAGRVQTPTLAMLVDRELEILTHRPVPFWRVQGTFQAAGHEYEGTWFDPAFKADPDRPRKDDWITDQAVLDRVLEEVRGKEGVAEEIRKPSKESAHPLFDLTSLQREANKRFGMSARATLSAAQRLYEGRKLITYPRTDSRCLPSDYRAHVSQVLDLMAGLSSGARSGGSSSGLDFGLYAGAARQLRSKGLENSGRIFNDKGVSDHFAIIPTTERPPASLSSDEARVYDLVVRRFLAAFFPPAVWIKVERTTRVGGHHFRTRASHLQVPGWREVYGREAEGESDKVLPALDPGQDRARNVPARNLEVEALSEQTRPPARITEARLLSLMENAGKMVDDEHIAEVFHDKGIGTPATRAEIIEALITREYAQRADRALKATTKGILLIDMLRRIQADRLASPELTGEMEYHLHQVEHGARTRDDFMTEIQDYTIDVVERAKSFEYDALYQGEPPLGPCPACGSRQVYEKARFYACEGNTGKTGGPCSFILWKDKGGRYLDTVTVRELLADRETDVLEGFSSARGQAYKAKLRLSEAGELELEGEKDAAESIPELAALPVSDDPLGPCPFDEGKKCQVVETPTHYQCQGICVQKDAKRKQGMVLPRVVCQRPITREEAQVYLETGKTDLLENFTSRFGKPFKAWLVLKDTGKHGFEFAPREKAAGSRGAAKAKAPRKAAARSKAPRKAPAKAAGAAKTPAARKTAAASKKSGKAGSSSKK